MKKKTKHTPGPWRLENDAQGPCMVMHPTLKGVAIASLSDLFRPVNGFHEPALRKPEPCPETKDVTYRPERVANARLIAASPDLLEALVETEKVIRNILTDSQLDERTACGLTLRRWSEKCKAAISKAEKGV